MDDHRKVRMEPPTSVIARLSPQDNNRRGYIRDPLIAHPIKDERIRRLSRIAFVLKQ